MYKKQTSTFLTLSLSRFVGYKTKKHHLCIVNNNETIDQLHIDYTENNEYNS